MKFGGNDMVYIFCNVLWIRIMKFIIEYFKLKKDDILLSCIFFKVG